MLNTLVIVLLGAAAIGLVLLAVQCVALWLHRRGTPAKPVTRPPVSILKPLCGLDDDLEAHLELFATLDYPRYELLLGLETAADPALPVARAAAKRFPGRVRVVIQRGAPGLNPKVNQLVTLAREATGEVLVVSDSNTRVPAGFLDEIVALLAKPEVGLVAHPVAGVGERRLGAALDNLHLTTIGLGCVAARRVAGQDLVIGKTMSLRKTDLEALGGFESFAHVLAEDYLMGRRVVDQLGLQVALAHTAVHSVSRKHPVGAFLSRYCRWSVMQRMAVGNGVYASQLLLNPSALCLLAFVLQPNRTTLAALAFCCTLRLTVDAFAGVLLRDHGFSLMTLAATPLKDLLVGMAWLYGATHDTVTWRGHPLRVLPGTTLERIAPHLELGEALPPRDSA